MPQGSSLTAEPNVAYEGRKKTVAAVSISTLVFVWKKQETHEKYMKLHRHI